MLLLWTTTKIDHASAAVYVEGVRALYHFDDIVDSSGYGRNLTEGGASGGDFQTSATSSLIGGYWNSNSANSTNDYLTATTTVQDISGDFSTGFWLYPFTEPGVADGYWVMGGTNTAKGIGHGYSRLCAAGTLEVKVGTSACDLTSVAGTYATSTWNWFFVQRIGSNVDVYKNNVLIKSGAATATTAPDTFQLNGLTGDPAGIHARYDEYFFATGTVSTSTRASLYNTGAGAEVCATLGCDAAPATSTASLIQHTPSNGSYLNPYNTVAYVSVSSTDSGVLKMYFQNNASTTVYTFPGNVSGGTYFRQFRFDTNLWAIWSTFKVTGNATSTSNIKQIDVGSAGNFYSTSTSSFFTSSTRDIFCAEVGNATTSGGFFSQSALDFKNGVSRGICDAFAYLFIGDPQQLPELDLRYRKPFNDFYAIYDIAQSLIATPTSTQSFGIIIPVLPRPATTTIFAFTSNQLETGAASSAIRTAQPFITFIAYSALILFSLSVGLGILVMFSSV